jgi:Peptidase family M23/Putative serine esterase (DUF676)
VSTNPRRRRLHQSLPFLVIVVVSGPGPAAANGAGDAWPTPVYLPPVDAPVADPFRAPVHPYGPGNRGIEYATVPGTVVRASADGTTVFAGPAAGALHVTVAHPDGVRTTYAFLAAISTVTGDVVDQGDPVGIAGARLHFSARIGAAYVDPAILMAAGPPRVRLVPERRERVDRAYPPDVGYPYSTTWRWATHSDLAWFGGEINVPSRPGPARSPPMALASATRELACTPVGLAPSVSGQRRIAVLVGGLGSSSEEAAVSTVDTAALGYAAGDVLRFSYSGGRIPGPAAVDLDHVASSSYSAADSAGDLEVAGARLARLIEQIATAAPDVPIDLIAHSQGGVVARIALSDLAAADGTNSRIEPSELATVVTLGAPHQGSDLASLAGLARSGAGGVLAAEAVERVGGLGFDFDGPAVQQLAVGSPLMRRLTDEALPDGPATLSIGARGDVVVPAARTELVGATNVVVSVPGVVTDHERLPGSAAATREIALARAGMPPSCEPFLEALADQALSATVGWIESWFSLGRDPPSHIASSAS